VYSESVSRTSPYFNFCDRFLDSSKRYAFDRRKRVHRLFQITLNPTLVSDNIYYAITANRNEEAELKPVMDAFHSFPNRRKKAGEREKTAVSVSVTTVRAHCTHRLYTTGPCYRFCRHRLLEILSKLSLFTSMQPRGTDARAPLTSRLALSRLRSGVVVAAGKRGFIASGGRAMVPWTDETSFAHAYVICDNEKHHYQRSLLENKRKFMHLRTSASSSFPSLFRVRNTYNDAYMHIIISDMY